MIDFARPAIVSQGPWEWNTGGVYPLEFIWSTKRRCLSGRLVESSHFTSLVDPGPGPPLIFLPGARLTSSPLWPEDRVRWPQSVAVGARPRNWSGLQRCGLRGREGRPACFVGAAGLKGNWPTTGRVRELFTEGDKSSVIGWVFFFLRSSIGGV